MEAYTIISIYNIIDRKKVLDLSKIFLKKNGVSTSYEIENDSNNNILRFIFRVKNKVPFDLLKYLNELKVSDKNLSDIEITHNLVPINEINFYGINTNNNNDNDNSLRHNRSKTNDLSINNNNNETYLQRHYFNDYSFKLSGLLEKTRYMDPHEKERLINKKENEKNNNNKNKFNSYFDKATILKEEFDKDKSIKMDKNEPYDDTFELKFRDINKKKWVGKENFKFY
jgi:hypothetical protein